MQLGLVASLNRPGGNLTRDDAIFAEVAAKGVELLHELLPATSSVGFLENPRSPIAEFGTRDALTAARAIGLKMQILHAGTEGEIDAAFSSLVKSTGALLVSIA